MADGLSYALYFACGKTSGSKPTRDYRPRSSLASLAGSVRVGDIAARYGGEEFIVAFYNTDEKTIKTRAESIREAVSRLQIKYGAQPVGPITISIGVAVYPADGRTTTELIESADKALYFAKTNGKNRIVLYSEIENRKSSVNKKNEYQNPSDHQLI
ncbi:GGDEF domain-containing protein [Legionella sainthelensi]|uniref:GGDEF domain-containing protein n=1 Tax=Legionella sainthelensi TaxID=28087 RepID=UPI00216593E6|nr:GGDEF domain-containing protein [Legionella sainthelensi]